MITYSVPGHSIFKGLEHYGILILGLACMKHLEILSLMPAAELWQKFQLCCPSVGPSTSVPSLIPANMPPRRSTCLGPGRGVNVASHWAATSAGEAPSLAAPSSNGLVASSLTCCATIAYPAFWIFWAMADPILPKIPRPPCFLP